MACGLPGMPFFASSSANPVAEFYNLRTAFAGPIQQAAYTLAAGLQRVPVSHRVSTEYAGLILQFQRLVVRFPTTRRVFSVSDLAAALSIRSWC